MPIGAVAGLFGFVTVWAVIGFNWAVAISLFDMIPTIYQETAVMSSVLNAVTHPHQLLITLPSAPVHPASSPPSWEALPLLILLCIIPSYISFYLVNRVKNNIRRRIAGVYGFK